jgi:hypothetical protein
MSEELGKIEKPSAEEFKDKRKLYFVPLIYSEMEASAEYLEKFNRYWDQVEKQLSELELKLGFASKIYHELIPARAEDGIKTLKELNESSCRIVENSIGKGAQLEATEEMDLLTEFMDWGRCLAIGLQNQKTFSKVYESYIEAGKKRNEYIAKHIDETLKVGEVGILFMREGHQVQFPHDVRVFYVAPPALDEIKRWLRDRQVKPAKADESAAAEKGDS